MNDRTPKNQLPATDEKFDSLLRQWHAQNKATAAASRDQLLARLQSETNAHTQRQHHRAHAAMMLVLWRLIMHRYTRIAASMVLVVTVLTLLFPPMTQQSMASGYVMLPDGGRLDAFDEQGEHIGPCPLDHTNVDVQIAGHFSRTTVRQRYRNPYQSKVEAVYTFPLGHDGAVDRMTMTIGDRVIKGEVQERKRARETYEAARDQGYVASLLEQERPNIFTQSVANIEPGAEIIIEISYVEILQSVDGQYTFAFPMVVAPRYIPGSPMGVKGPEPGTFAPDTDQVEDASRVTPKPVKPQMRAGHDISVQVRIDTGGPGIAEITSGQHEIVQFNERTGPDAHLTGVSIALKAEDEIPNRDFLLSWKQLGNEIEEAIFTHTGDAEKYGTYAGGFFSMILQPPHRVDDDLARPRELIFVMDNSGSMGGSTHPGSSYSALDAAKDVLNKAIDTMRPNDRFNVISFNNSVATLWDAPRPNTDENRRIAQRFIDQRQGGGGTEMASAIDAALGINQHTQQASGMLTPRQLADQLADGRRVKVMAALADIHVRQSHSGDQHVIRIENDLHINLDLRSELPTVFQPHGVQVQLEGTWQTANGRRVFVVEQATVAGENDAAALMRIVVFATDGLVGNDETIIRAVREHAHDTRMFTFGMSRSPNRFLLDKMAEAGRGASDYILPGDDPAPIVQRFADRIATPVLTDISLQFDGVEVVDVLPGLDRLPDLFDVSPLVIHGRYTQPGSGTLTIRGRTGAGTYQRTLDVHLPQQQADHDVIATLWARTNIDKLMVEDRKDEIVALGEQFQIMSKHTSFVAVEMQRKTVDGKSMLVRVPIEFPEGMSWDGVFGDEIEQESQRVDRSRVSRRLGAERAPAPSPDTLHVLAPSAPPARTHPNDWPSTNLRSEVKVLDGAPARPDGPPASGSRGLPGGGGGGAGSGGGLFGNPSGSFGYGAVDRELTQSERLESAADVVQSLIAPDAWDDLGGNMLTLQRVNGRLQVRVLEHSAEAAELAEHARRFIENYEAIIDGTARSTGEFANAGFTESPNDLAALRVLHERMFEIGFESQPLRNAVEQFARETGVELHTNWKSLELIGLFPSRSVTVPRENRSIAHTLQLLFDTGDDLDEVRVFVQDGQIRITSDEHARRQTHVLVYDVADLVSIAQGPSASRYEILQHLVDVLQQNVDPYGWRSWGGDTASLHELDQWLFIENTTDNHRAIQDLLSQLRAALHLPISGQRVYEAAINAYEQPVMVYDVRDLIAHEVQRSLHVQRPEEAPALLVDVLVEGVDPSNWRDVGGDVGSIQHFAGLFIISNTFANHESIAGYLEQLRAAMALDKGDQTPPGQYGEGQQVIVMYDIRDLLENEPTPERVDRLADMIMQEVDTEGWYDHGGSRGYIRAIANVLIISNTPENQQAVQQSLYRIRSAGR